jgi:hypothetical protein
MLPELHLLCGGIDGRGVAWRVHTDLAGCSDAPGAEADLGAVEQAEWVRTHRESRGHLNMV